MAETVTIARIAEATSSSTRQALRRASDERWSYTLGPSDGGRRPRLYAVDTLPREVREALVAHALRNRPAPVPTMVPAPLDGGLPATVPDGVPEGVADDRPLKGWQLEIATARLVLVREAERLGRTGGKMAGLQALVTAAAAGTLTGPLLAAAGRANAKKGAAGRSLSLTTLRRWCDVVAKGGDLAALAPAPSRPEDTLPPEWMADFLDFYWLPSKPSVSEALREMARRRPDATVPTLRTAQREIAAMPAIERNRGRMGPRELRKLKAFVRRDTSALWPTAVYSTDGHTHHAMVAHPLTGKPFRPEITSTVDIVTARLVGWSVGLAENTWGTIDALRQSFGHGVCDIWYVDRGRGFNNDVLDNELSGFLAQFGVEKHTSLPYRSQARGAIERLHQMWISASRTVAGYVGTDMDPEARKRIERRVSDDLDARGSSSLLMSWPDFVRWCDARVADYNARPHSRMPTISDPVTGKRRHMSPDEVWTAWEGRGWQPDRIDPGHAHLFRPREKRRVARGEVQLFSNRYFAWELEDWHEQDVLVAYDIHDADRVWVTTLDGQYVCEAKFGGNSVSYFPVPVARQAHDRRVAGQIKRAQAHVLAAEAERGAPLIDLRRADVAPALPPVDAPPATPVVAPVMRLPVPPRPAPAPAAEPAPSAAPSPRIDAATGRPIFGDDLEMAAWLLGNPGAVTAHDARHMRDCLRKTLFRLRLEVGGIDAAALSALIKPLLTQEISA